MDEAKVQEKYVEYKTLEQQIKQVQKQIQVLENQLMEISTVTESLDELQQVNEGTEILIPISNGIFTKASLKDNKELIVNVGANVAVNKKIPETKKLMDTQQEEIKKMHEHMNSELEKLAVKATVIEKELATMVEDKQ